ncbi:MAG: anti-sigma factor [Tepidisphaeraceae bacterium]
MTDPIYHGPDVNRAAASAAHGRRSNWSGLLVFACLALGFVASAVQYERVAATSQRDRAEILATADSRMEGQLEDLGKLLSDPQTRMVRLTGSPGSSVANAVIAWNAAARRGYLLCDQLPVLDSGSGYELWALHGGDDPVKIATIVAKAGDSVYLFQAWGEMDGKIRLQITAGPRSSDKPPILAGEIQ